MKFEARAVRTIRKGEKFLVSLPAKIRRMTKNPTKGNRKYSVVRAASNAWALKRKVYNDSYKAWMEQADRLFSSKREAQQAGRDWLNNG